MKKAENCCGKQERKLLVESNIAAQHSTGATEVSNEFASVVRVSQHDSSTPTSCQMSSMKETSSKSDIFRTLTESFASEDLQSLVSPYQFEDDSNSNKKQSSKSMDSLQEASQKVGKSMTTPTRLLTEQERIAERNRKGRERSLRTRRRNASKLKNLEFNCSYLSMENSLLEAFIRAIRLNTSPEEVVSLTREILNLQSSKTKARDKYVVEEGKASRSLKQGGTLVEELVVDPALKRAAQKEESLVALEFSNFDGWEPSSTGIDGDKETEENLLSSTAIVPKGSSATTNGGLSNDLKQNEECEKQNKKGVKELGEVPAELLTFLSNNDRQGFDCSLPDSTRSLLSLETADLAELLDLDE